MPAKENRALVIAGHVIQPGQRETLNLPIPQLYTHTPMEMPVHVVHGKSPGPCLFICAAIHGDELNGVEIVRRLMAQANLSKIKGTIIAIPIVNVYGVIHRSRYLPDRRDLNRSFPGSNQGSLASRLAHLLLNEIIVHATHAIDLHTGAVHRSNIPQIRGNLENIETLKMAEAFGAPIILDSKLRDGSLRQAVADFGIPSMIYEAGEALRLDEVSIRAGVRGINHVMRHLRMIAKSKKKSHLMQLVIAHSSAWMRAPISGVLLNNTRLGAFIEQGDVLGVVADPFGNTETKIVATSSGVVIGRTHLPLVNEGDAVINIAHLDTSAQEVESVSTYREQEKEAINGEADVLV